MRNALDLFVNVIRCKSQPGVQTRHKDIDIVCVRQNTEGEYAMLEHENVPGVVESLKVVTDKSTERLCRFAFDYARDNGRKKVTLVHKANIMKITDGLFLEVSKRVAKDYPEIEHDNMVKKSANRPISGACCSTHALLLDHRQLLHATGLQPLAVRCHDPD